MIRRGFVATLIGWSVVSMGCQAENALSLPGFGDTASVAISATESIQADLGSGIAEQANTVWAVHKVDDDSLLFRVRYGPTGEFAELFDNATLGQPWLGSQIFFDTELHDTAFAGGQYLAGSYMAQQGDQVGVYGEFFGLFLGVHVGTARVSFYATIQEDRVEDIFSRRVEILGTTPFDSPGDADIEVYAERESL